MQTAAEPTTTITVRVPEPLRAQFDDLARVTGRTRQYLALEALQRYIGVEAWQIGKILEGIRAADVGDFASDDEVERVFAKYSPKRAEDAI